MPHGLSLLPKNYQVAWEQILEHLQQASRESWHLDGVELHSRTLAATLVYRPGVVTRQSALRDMTALGMKGAALAALGEMAVGFLLRPGVPAVAAAPFGERNEGVKLGESTFNDFLA